MLTKQDKDLIKDTSKEIIEGTGEEILRRRLKTNIPPHEYDFDFGETVPNPQSLSPNRYDEVIFIGKVFFSVTEKQLLEVFGEVKSADAIVHIPIDIDIIAGDILLIRGIQYRVHEIKESPLKSFNIARIEKIQ